MSEFLDVGCLHASESNCGLPLTVLARIRVALRSLLGHEHQAHATASTNNNHRTEPQLHRIRHVRLREGVELRAVARRMGVKKTGVRVLRREENSTTDLRLSDLHRWQRALSVPIAELLVEDDRPLSVTVKERAQMLRVMKTVMTIHEQSTCESIRRMAETIVGELREAMPELIDIGPWRGRESLEPTNLGRSVECTVPDHLFTA